MSHETCQGVLTFSPEAWLKLKYFCHTGEHEVGGFGISDIDDPLYIVDFVTVKQNVTWASVEFDDASSAEFLETCVDQGIAPSRCMRIWCHTHPGSSPEPSGTDERTFERCFGKCDWSVMFILGRTGRTYARMRFASMPNVQPLLTVAVDWESWPYVADAWSHEPPLADWKAEFADNIVHEKFERIGPAPAITDVVHATLENVPADSTAVYDFITCGLCGSVAAVDPRDPSRWCESCGLNDTEDNRKLYLGLDDEFPAEEEDDEFVRYYESVIERELCQRIDL